MELPVSLTPWLVQKQEDRGDDHGSTPRDYCGPPDDFSGFLEFSQVSTPTYLLRPPES